MLQNWNNPNGVAESENVCMNGQSCQTLSIQDLLKNAIPTSHVIMVFQYHLLLKSSSLVIIWRIMPYQKKFPIVETFFESSVKIICEEVLHI
jgi:hypothetical protein